VVIRNKSSDFVVAASVNLSTHTLAHSYSETYTNRSRGSNGSDTCFSNELERKIQICTNMLLQRTLQKTGILHSISGNFA